MRTVGPKLRALLRVAAVPCTQDTSKPEPDPYPAGLCREAERRGLIVTFYCPCGLVHVRLTPLGRIALRLPVDASVLA